MPEVTVTFTAERLSYAIFRALTSSAYFKRLDLFFESNRYEFCYDLRH